MAAELKARNAATHVSPGNLKKREPGQIVEVEHFGSYAVDVHILEALAGIPLAGPSRRRQGDASIDDRLGREGSRPRQGRFPDLVLGAREILQKGLLAHQHVRIGGDDLLWHGDSASSRERVQAAYRGPVGRTPPGPIARLAATCCPPLPSMVARSRRPGQASRRWRCSRGGLTNSGEPISPTSQVAWSPTARYGSRMSMRGRRTERTLPFAGPAVAIRHRMMSPR